MTSPGATLRRPLPDCACVGPRCFGPGLQQRERALEPVHDLLRESHASKMHTPPVRSPDVAPPPARGGGADQDLPSLRRVGVVLRGGCSRDANALVGWGERSDAQHHAPDHVGHRCAHPNLRSAACMLAPAARAKLGGGASRRREAVPAEGKSPALCSATWEHS